MAFRFRKALFLAASSMVVAMAISPIEAANTVTGLFEQRVIVLLATYL